MDDKLVIDHVSIKDHLSAASTFRGAILDAPAKISTVLAFFISVSL